VLKGIDRAFESYARSRRAAGGRQLKSLSYCVDAVLEAADEEKEAAAGTGPVRRARVKETENRFRARLRAFFTRNIERFHGGGRVAALNRNREFAARGRSPRARFPI
jgi:hypothetical protein